MIQLSNWETPTWFGDFPEGTSKPIAVFDVEVDGRHIREMGLWHNGDAFEVRCNSENKEEMTDDCREQIKFAACCEYRRRNP
ncbi:hypothetical protein ACKWRH_20785 [Bradyrhizobium sp. Pa8]|uniref:hypothetical protein n=1 Tax=Bradyrhizobium sp. Pa8 TaxID=3386552 RepID=UPI00403F1D3B